MQRSLSMGRNGIPLCFTMFSIRLLYPIIDRIKYDVADLNLTGYMRLIPSRQQTTYDASTRPVFKIIF